MDILKKTDPKFLIVIFILLMFMFHTNKNIFNCLNVFDKNLRNNNIENYRNLDNSIISGFSGELSEDSDDTTITENDVDITQLIDDILKTMLETSKNEVDKKFGNFSEVYMKLLNHKMNNVNSQNKNLKLDLSNLLSLRESNHRRQVFLEVLLFNLVNKYKTLIKELEKCNKDNLESNEQLKQTLYVNQLLQNKIQEVTDEKENALNESKVLNSIGKNYKYIKVGPKMYKELERLKLHKNIPNDMRKNIEKGLIHVLKV